MRKLFYYTLFFLCLASVGGFWRFNGSKDNQYRISSKQFTDEITTFTHLIQDFVSIGNKAMEPIVNAFEWFNELFDGDTWYPSIIPGTSHGGGGGGGHSR